jgi:hypothetical protein
VRSNKRYSNVAFTKRVDYDGGAHRPPRGQKEPLACSRCGAVYAKRRWIVESDPRAIALREQAGKTMCPACVMVQKKQVRGILRLEGAFVSAHRSDLQRLLENEAARAAEDNPLGRIAFWDITTKGVLTVATTTEHLIERLGHAVHRAFDGTIDYGFSHGNKFARATWRRD